MAQYHGKDGVVKSGSSLTTGANTTIGEVTGWSVDQSAGTYQTTEAVMGAAAPVLTYSAAESSWTATVDCKLDLDDTAQVAFTIGSSVELILYPEGDAAAGDDVMYGDGVITGVGMSGSVSDISTRSFTIQGTGALTFGVTTV